MNRKLFGSRLKEARESKKLSRADIAAIVGIQSETAVGGWERGEYLPELEKIIAIADALSVSIDWLTGRPTAEDSKAYDYKYSPEHMHIIQRWVLLPPFQQDHLRALIEALALPHDPRYKAWEKDVATKAKK